MCGHVYYGKISTNLFQISRSGNLTKNKANQNGETLEHCPDDNTGGVISERQQYKTANYD